MEIVEAARVDGSGEFFTFNRIVLPMLKPAISVQMIFTFVESWNNYFLPALLLDTFSSLTESRVLILLLLNLLFLIIGMLMEANAAIIMMTPILMPLLTLYGINPLMFGIVMSFNLCIGLVTPPVGLCLLLSNQIGETSLSKSLKALMPLLLISIVVLLLITYVDPLTTWLPSLLKK